MMADSGLIDGSSDLSNDGQSASRLETLPGQGAHVANPRPGVSVDGHSTQRAATNDGFHQLRPGLPREWSGLSNASDPYNYSDAVYVPVLPAEASWTEEQQATLQQPDNQAMITGEPVTSATAEQDISESMILEQSMVDYLFASPKESTKDTMSSSLVDDFSRVIASDPPSNSGSTPRSHSSRGRSRGTSHSQHSSRSDFRIPDLKPSFFESDFYRRFHIQSEHDFSPSFERRTEFRVDRAYH